MNAPTPPETLLANAVALHRTGNLAGAEPLYRTLLERQPGHPDVLHLLGVLRSQAGDPADGAALIAEAIARRGNVAAYHSNLALALKALGRFEEAEAALRNAIALAPGAGPLVALGGVRRACGRYADALASYRDALVFDPGDGAAQDGIAHTTAELAAGGRGHPEAMLTAYRRAFRLRPAAPFAAYNLGSTLQKAGESGAAITAYQAAAALDPAEPAVLSGLGVALLAAGRADRAAATLARVVRLRPRDAQDRFHLAEAAQAAGAADCATAAYKDTVALRPTDYTAWENAALLHWLRQRSMAYFLDQIALIQGFADVERRRGAVGILPIEELARRLGVSDVFLPFFDEKHRAGFADRLSALTLRVHEEMLTEGRSEEERRAALTGLVRGLQAAGTGPE